MKDAKVKTSQSTNLPSEKFGTDGIQDSTQTNHTSSGQKFVPSDEINLKPFKGVTLG